jgi:hypothetical protein
LHKCPPIFADFLDRPWGVAIAVLVLLVPRLVARNRDPFAMRRFGSTRLIAGYAVAIVVALAALALAEPLHVRPWIEATPVRAVRELVASSLVAKYLLAAMVAWLFAAYLVAPVAAWLASYGRANGLLVAALCLPAAAAIGASLSFAWAKPFNELPFTVASTCCLVLIVVLGFSVGAKLPLAFRLRGENAT